MKKSKITLLTAAALVLVLACGILLAACNDNGGKIGSMGVKPFPDTFTNDLDTTAAENLAASAQQITASSAADSAGNVADGDTSTAWTAESTTGQYIEITFPSPTEINTVVLRENGNFISGFGFVLPDEDGAYPEDMVSASFYRQQDRIERYRYCTFATQEDVTEFRIWFGGTDAGKSLSIAEVEIYNVAPKEYDGDFRVFNYYTAADLAAMTDDELSTELGRGVITDMILISMVFWGAGRHDDLCRRSYHLHTPSRQLQLHGSVHRGSRLLQQSGRPRALHSRTARHQRLPRSIPHQG